jgi:hypothetical protein
MQQTLLADPGAVHFTDEQGFRLKLPNLATLIDSQLPRRALTAENCTFEYAHNGRLKNSLGQICTFQASFRLKDNPESRALFELVEALDTAGIAKRGKIAFRYERDMAAVS